MFKFRFDRPIIGPGNRPGGPILQFLKLSLRVKLQLPQTEIQ